MNKIILGTTPTILFTFRIVNPSAFVAAEMTIKGRSNILLLKTLSTATVEDAQISWKLSQQETINLGIGTYKIMCNWLLGDGTRGASEETSLQVLSNHRSDVLEPEGSDVDDEIVIPVIPSSVSDNAVTPQMYGAIGDGVTDDTTAIQNALDSGALVYFPRGTYLISNPIVITDKVFWNMYARDATFRYTGSGYAIRILSAENCHIEIGQIKSPNGGGIEFYSDSSNSWNQYVSLTFNWIECSADCIHIEVSSDGWCNENQIYGGRFVSGQNGVHFHHTGENYTNGWKFYNCGIEGVTNGFLFDAGSGYINSCLIVGTRYEESYETVLKTVGRVYDCLWIGTSVFKPTEINCSADTSRFEILAPIKTIWDGELIRHRGCIIDGNLMAEKTSYEEVT